MMSTTDEEKLDRFVKEVSIKFNNEVEFPTYILPTILLGMQICSVIDSESGLQLFFVQRVGNDVFVSCRFPVSWYQLGYGFQGLLIPMIAGPFHQDTSPDS